MRTLKFALTALYILGLQQRMFAPPSSDIIFSLNPYGSLSEAPFLTVMETNTGSGFSGLITSWAIPTPDGLLTPADSILSNPGFFLSPTMIPLDDLNFLDNGQSFSANLSPSLNGGSVDYPGGSFDGTWSAADNSDPMLLFALGSGCVLAANFLSRRFQPRKIG